MGHWQDWANLVLGIWPILSPWSLGLQTATLFVII